MAEIVDTPAASGSKLAKAILARIGKPGGGTGSGGTIKAAYILLSSSGTVDFGGSFTKKPACIGGTVSAWTTSAGLYTGATVTISGSNVPLVFLGV
jgi:hypothetical protein